MAGCSPQCDPLHRRNADENTVGGWTGQGVVPAGPPFAYYPSEPSDVVDVEAGVTIAGELEDTADVVSSHLPCGRAVVAVHVGPYEALERTYRSLLAEIERAGLVRRLGMWEEYLTDPDSEPDPARWRTRVVMPIAG